MKKVDAIIQTRLTSKRLPNKILKSIKKKTMIDIMYSRLKFSKKINRIIFAIPNNKKNLKLKNILNEKKYLYFTSDENNVLKRYYLTAKKYKCNNIMRLTSDCPLIDYKICEKVTEIFFKKKLDYIYTSEKFADGLDVEIIKFSCLKKVYKKAKTNIQKEHVTYFIKSNKNLFKTYMLENDTDDSIIRITLDQAKDLLVIKKIINKFPEILDNVYVSSKKIVSYLKKNKPITKINSDIIRNSALKN